LEKKGHVMKVETCVIVSPCTHRDISSSVGRRRSSSHNKRSGTTYHWRGSTHFSRRKRDGR